MRLAAFGSMYFEISNPFSSAARVILVSAESKAVILSIPFLPAVKACQVSSALFPTGETAPIPVTTTLFI